MTPARKVIQRVLSLGGRIRPADGMLELTADRPLPDEVIDEVRRYKADILQALEEPAANDGESVQDLAAAFYNHLFGPAKDTRCCYAPHGRYCAEGRRLKDRYYAAVS